MFQKKAPQGIEPRPGEEGQAPITKVKKPMKKKKSKKPGKFSVASEGQKGKISAMMGRANGSIAADVFAELKSKKNKKRGEGKESKKPQSLLSNFVPEQKRTGIRG
jgi:hypothetical protein